MAERYGGAAGFDWATDTSFGDVRSIMNVHRGGYSLLTQVYPGFGFFAVALVTIVGVAPGSPPTPTVGPGWPAGSPPRWRRCCRTGGSCTRELASAGIASLHGRTECGPDQVR